MHPSTAPPRTLIHSMYVCMIARMLAYARAPLQVLLSLLTTKFLHREIREKGGAYGGGASMGGNLLRFYSYRDPGAQATLNAFDASGMWAAEGSFADRDIAEAKLSVFQKVRNTVEDNVHCTGSLSL